AGNVAGAVRRFTVDYHASDNLDRSKPCQYRSLGRLFDDAGNPGYLVRLGGRSRWQRADCRPDPVPGSVGHESSVHSPWQPDGRRPGPTGALRAAVLHGEYLAISDAGSRRDYRLV